MMLKQVYDLLSANISSKTRESNLANRFPLTERLLEEACLLGERLISARSISPPVLTRLYLTETTI